MKLRTVITTVTTAAVLSTAGVAIAGAASSSAPTSAPTAVTSAGAKAEKPAVADRGARHHRRHRHHRRLRALVRKVVTDTIGIDRKTLRRELRSGKTIGEIAGAHNVEPTVVVNALVTAATTKLDAAASAGKITTDRAHKIEARLPDRFTKLVDSWHPRRLRNATAEARR
jgi:hypothetical protein